MAFSGIGRPVIFADYAFWNRQLCRKGVQKHHGSKKVKPRGASVDMGKDRVEGHLRHGERVLTSIGLQLCSATAKILRKNVIPCGCPLRKLDKGRSRHLHAQQPRDGERSHEPVVCGTRWCAFAWKCGCLITNQQS